MASVIGRSKTTFPLTDNIYGKMHNKSGYVSLYVYDWEESDPILMHPCNTKEVIEHLNMSGEYGIADEVMDLIMNSTVEDKTCRMN